MLTAQPPAETALLPPGQLWPTLTACALVMVAFTGAAARLTGGFEQWTFEALRRFEARQGAMQFPAMDLVDSVGVALHLPAGGTGEVLVVDFIYTTCETVCQALGAEFYQAQERLKRNNSRIQLLSVSIDPRRDTPEALVDYGVRHRADPAVWTIATPRTADEGQRARRALNVITVPDGRGGFVHNGAIHVVDPRGHVAGIFDTADWERALSLAERLQKAAA